MKLTYRGFVSNLCFSSSLRVSHGWMDDSRVVGGWEVIKSHEDPPLPPGGGFEGLVLSRVFTYLSVEDFYSWVGSLSSLYILIFTERIFFLSFEGWRFGSFSHLRRLHWLAVVSSSLSSLTWSSLSVILILISPPHHPHHPRHPRHLRYPRHLHHPHHPRHPRHPRHPLRPCDPHSRRSPPLYHKTYHHFSNISAIQNAVMYIPTSIKMLITALSAGALAFANDATPTLRGDPAWITEFEDSGCTQPSKGGKLAMDGMNVDAGPAEPEKFTCHTFNASGKFFGVNYGPVTTVYFYHSPDCSDSIRSGSFKPSDQNTDCVGYFQMSLWGSIGAIKFAKDEYIQNYPAHDTLEMADSYAAKTYLSLVISLDIFSPGYN